jgi:hypothetical protein
MKKLQNGGLTTGAKKVQKQGPIKTIKTINKFLKKRTPRKTNTGCFGAGGSKMQNGGMIPRCPGPNCPKRPKTGPIKAIKKVIKKITRPKMTTDTPYGNFPKDMSRPQQKMQNGGTTEPEPYKIERNKIKQTGPRKFLFQNQSPSRGTRTKEVTLDQNLYDPNKNSGAVTKTIRNNAGEIIKQKTRIVSNAKAQKKYDKILKSTAKKTNTCFSGNCK